MKKIITAILFSFVTFASAHADDTPFYVGARAGDGYIGGFGGYQIDKMFSVEAHFNKFDKDSTPFWSRDVSSIGVAGVAMFPMKFDKAPPFSFFAKAGVERIHTKTNLPAYSTKDVDTELTLGGGAQYDFNKIASARVGIDVAGEADSLYLGAVFNF